MARIVVVLATIGAAASGCASRLEPERHSVLQLDACGTMPVSQPVDLETRAQEQGCAYSSIGGWGVLELPVKAVCSPREFVVSGRHGVERIRVRYSAPASARLAALDPHELTELRARLDQKLTGLVLFEANDVEVPVVSDDGLRSVSIWTSDLRPLDELVSAEIESMPCTRHVDRPEGREMLDLSPVPRAPAARRDRVTAIVELAERFSSYRAPPDLAVEWITSAELPTLDSAALSAWRDTEGSCFDSDDFDLEGLDAPESWYGLSLPGGHVYLQADHDWRELELRYFLLHELMHQHEYALCQQGQVPFAHLPGLLMQAYASSMARVILRRSGADPETLQLVRDWDGSASVTQVFDDFRSRLGLSPDEYLLYLVEHEDEAKQLAKGGYVAMTTCPQDGLLSFKCVGRSARGSAIVNVANTTSQPCSISSNGWWHIVTKPTKQGERMVGGTPFALRLPPQGSITLLTEIDIDADMEVVDCHVVYAVTPAPLFDETEPAALAR